MTVESREPLEPTGRRLGWRVWLPLGLIVYAGFVALCFSMEAEGRARFSVPSRAEIAAIEERTALIRAEGVRARALEQMREWRPYALYSTGMGIVIIGGTLLATILGARVVWRGVQKTSVRKADRIFFGVLFIAMIALFLLVWPSFVAEKRLESRATTYLAGQ